MDRTAPARHSSSTHRLVNGDPWLRDYQNRLTQWAGKEQNRVVAVEAIKNWIAAGNPDKILALNKLGLTELPPIPQELGIKLLQANHNQLTYLDAHSLPTTLEQLDLRHNALTTIPHSLPYAKLKLLNLAHNKLNELPQQCKLLRADCKVLLAGNPLGEHELSKFFGPPNVDGARYPLPSSNRQSNETIPPQQANTSDAVDASSEQRAKLGLAIMSGEVEFVNIALQDPDLDPNKPTSPGHPPPLALALLMYVRSQNKSLAILRRLLDDSRIDPNVKDAEGQSGLNIAVIYNNETLLGLFLKHPKINFASSGSELAGSLLYQAFMIANNNVFETLLSHPKCDPNIYSHGIPMLHHAVANASNPFDIESGNRKGKLLQLINHPAVMLDQTANDVTALEILTRINNPDPKIIITLLNRGAKVSNVKRIEAQRKIINIYGADLFNTLTAPQEFLSRLSLKNPTEGLNVDQLMQHQDLVKNADAALKQVQAMPSDKASFVLAALALYTKSVPEKRLEDYFYLKEAATLVTHPNPETRSKIHSEVLRKLQSWDQRGLNDGLKFFGEDQPKLASMTQDLLKAWQT